MMSLRGLDEKVNVNNAKDDLALLPPPLKAAAPQVDDNDIMNIKTAERKDDEDIVDSSGSFSSSSCRTSISSATQLRLTITDSQTQTSRACCENDGSTIEVEVLCADTDFRQQVVVIGTTESSSPDNSADELTALEGDDSRISQQPLGEEFNKPVIAPTNGNIAVDDHHSDDNCNEIKETDLFEVLAGGDNTSSVPSVDKPEKEHDAFNYQPYCNNSRETAKRIEPRESNNPVVVGNGRGASSSFTSKEDDANDHLVDYREEAIMTPHIDIGFPPPDKTRAWTEDSSLSTASSCSSVVAVDIPGKAENKVVSESLAMLDVSCDGVSREESSSAIRSDSGESGCTSTTPMITLSILGVDLLDKNEDIFPTMAADGDMRVNSDYNSTVSVDDNLNKSAISDESTSPQRDIEESDMTPSQLVKLISLRNSPPPLSPDSGYDMKRLSERLKDRLSKRIQTNGMVASPTVPTAEEGSESSKPVRDLARDRLLWESRLQAARLQQRPRVPRAKSSVFNTDTDILSIEGQSSKSREMRFPDTVTFSDSEHDATSSQQQQERQRQQDGSTKIRSHYRKSYSEVGIPSSFSTSRSSRSKTSKNHQSLAHGIGILQPNGIVYNDALLLRLARNARYGRLRGEVLNAVPYDNAGISAEGVRQYNHVKLHVYDLMTNDSLVEMPYFNCNFPIGHCFKVVNDGCHMLGTGAYHVGVEVNGVEYAFGANNIIGMCGIFTCVPKESPGYEYRQTIDFGQLHTIKRTWIRFPKKSTGVMSHQKSKEDGDDSTLDDSTMFSIDAPSSMKTKKCVYSFCEIESFADGHAIIHSMAREYMGSDYDLLRKNCCTFALDACIRLGVEKSDIPKWFYNAAQAGADAEDAISNMEKSVLGMLDCHGGVDPLDLECYNHGFEVIMEEEKTHNCDLVLTVMESPAMRTPRVRRPLNDFNETASWTY